MGVTMGGAPQADPTLSCPSNNPTNPTFPQVEWLHPGDPTKGAAYLYLSPEDHAAIAARAAEAGAGPAVQAVRLVTESGEERYRLTDVIGVEDGLGVECLSGSGAIAGVYSRAFREGFTVTLVSGRTVGIGAYLARLGRRCVQRGDQPVILTGYAALNKVLGREVYTSHMQLGGPRVMGSNGVSHHVVEDDLAGEGVGWVWGGWGGWGLGGLVGIGAGALGALLLVCLPVGVLLLFGCLPAWGCLRERVVVV